MASVTDMNAMFLASSNFNQCLSTWADKTLPNVSVTNIFQFSGCPNQNTVATVGPWCQFESEQCSAPSESPSMMPSTSNMPSDLPSVPSSTSNMPSDLQSVPPSTSNMPSDLP